MRTSCSDVQGWSLLSGGPGPILLAAYVTREHSLPVLEAAHIQPYSAGGQHEVVNVLLLRSDRHRLFDRGCVAVTPDDRFVVSSRLREKWSKREHCDDLVAIFHDNGAAPTVVLPSAAGTRPARSRRRCPSPKARTLASTGP